MESDQVVLVKGIRTFWQEIQNTIPKFVYGCLLFSLMIVIAQQLFHRELANPLARFGTGFAFRISQSPEEEQPWLFTCANRTKHCDFHPNDTSILYGLPLTTIRQASVNGTIMDYLTDYKNPCWFEEEISENGIRCLPYLYLLGVGKSGTSSLYTHIIQHGDIAKRQEKELFWWGNVKNRYSLRKYISFFRTSGKEIYNSTIENFHHKITLDATPSYFTHQGELQLLPGNRKLSEPKYTLADTLYRLNPRTRLIVILRHPTDRLYSHYHHIFGRRTSFSPEHFHQVMRDSLAMMSGCLETASLNSCVFNYTFTRHMLDVFHVPLYYSMYFPFAKAWLRAFPRKQMLFIKAEDFYADQSSTMKDVFKFLDLDSSKVNYSALSLNKNAHSHYHTSYRSTILPETRDMLDNFFTPLNQALAELLRDDRFLFRR